MNRGGQLTTNLSQKEMQKFSDYMKAKGITSKYAATKQIILDHLENRVDFAEPSTVVGALEKRAEEIDKLTPKQAKSELTKWFEKKGSRRAAVARSMYAPTTFNNLMRKCFETKEPPLESMWLIIEFLQEQLLAARSQGKKAMRIISTWDSEHWQATNTLGKYRRHA